MAVEIAKGVTLEKPGEEENFLKDGEGILFASLDKVVNWARRSSILAHVIRPGVAARSR